MQSVILPGPFDFVVQRGAGHVVDFTFKNKAGEAIDLTGATFKAVAKTPTATIDDFSDQWSIEDAAGGKARCTWTAAQSSALTAARGEWDLLLTLNGQEPQVVLAGKFTVTDQQSS